MTILQPLQIRDVWLRNGGSPALSPIATGVSLAESNGWVEAVSPADDHGLWQINRIHFGTFGLTDKSVLNPDINAQVAITISSNGRNWAAWCTCWNDPGPNCGHGLLPVPQRGSPAWNRMIGVNAILGTASDTPAAPASTANLNSFTTAWNQVADLHGPYARATYATLSTITNQIGRLRP